MKDEITGAIILCVVAILAAIMLVITEAYWAPKYQCEKSKVFFEEYRTLPQFYDEDRLKLQCVRFGIVFNNPN